MAVAVFALLIGVFCGITWEQRNVGSFVVDLQTQVGELQQIIKKLPATLNAPPPKKQKKGRKASDRLCRVSTLDTSLGEETDSR